MTNLKQFLTKPKRIDFVRYLNNKEEDVWSAKAVRQTDISTPGIRPIIDKMEEQSLITKDAKGNNHIIELTDKGRKLAEAVERFNSELEEVEKQ